MVEGLGAAHAAGLIHRDIKPENVLIADDGRIKIGDFGLARAVTTTTSTGALIGTVAYLSPELVLGKPADARSDIYSVGIMLYEMLTGQQPFDGEVPIQVAYQHVNSTVGPPSGLVPGLAEEVDELVQWCTANDPEKRPVDGNALLSELRHIRTNLTDAELDLQPPAAAARGACRGRPARRRRGTPPGRAARNRTLPPAPARLPSAAAPGSHTEVLSPVRGTRGAAPTEIISHTSNPTTVISATRWPAQFGSTPTTPQAPRFAAPADYGDGGHRPLPLSKREQRKQDRDEEKARSRAAATPVRTLREGNPRRRGVLWIVILVIAALLATGAGWFFGMGPGSPGTMPAGGQQDRGRGPAAAPRPPASSPAPRTCSTTTSAPGWWWAPNPEAGTEIRKFQPVSLFVSKGPQLFPLPATDRQDPGRRQECAQRRRDGLG